MLVSLRQLSQEKLQSHVEGLAPIATPDGESFEQFVQNAFIAEAYDESDANKASGNLDKIDFNSNSGYWYIDLTVNSLSGESIRISEEFKYKTSFNSETACNQTAQALMPAVQNATHQMIHHPKFITLIE